MDMVMEMMDMPPAPEELEWLESNSLLPEEEGGYDFFPPEEENDDAGGQEPNLGVGISSDTSSDPPVAAVSEFNQALGKRRISESSDGHETFDDEKRGNKRRAMQGKSDEDEEDWLLPHSLPKDSFAEGDVNNVSTAPDVLYEEKILSRYALEIEGECMPVTGPCGNRVYAKISSLGVAPRNGKLSGASSYKGLLSEPIDVLSKKVEHEALAKALQETSRSAERQTHSAMPMLNEQLWVEKYAPNSFTELLSDEHTNREVLIWLKQWDSCVFGSQIRATTDDVLFALRQHSSISQNQKFSSNRSFYSGRNGSNFNKQQFKPSNFPDREGSNPEHVMESRSRMHTVGPPEQKVLLLCGPPGLGKTTLAHVTARHCGYRVVEINASDDRSAAAVESKILDVMQMNSVVPDSKPKCLIIDEIDGALGEGKGAVEVILKMLAAEKKSSVDKQNSPQETQTKRSSLRKGQKTSPLSRPIICICNDVYAPALRPLRQIAKVHTFVQPTISRIVNRLKFICKKEGFRTNTTALSALAECTDCDIRSCLNTLQFLNKKHETINVLDISSQVIGRKDMSKSVFDVWKEVFQKRKVKGDRKSHIEYSTHGTFEFMYSLISNRGEYELTMDGIHENFLHLSYHDPMMQKTVKCLNILGVSDKLHQYVYRTQHMSLYAYQPSLAVSIRQLIAQVERPNIEWPKTYQRCRTMLVEKKELFKMWQNKITPLISRHLSPKSFVEDVVSPLLHILSPRTLRPVALHLLSEREKYELSQLVDTMVSYCVSYRNSEVQAPEKFQNKYGVPDGPSLFLDPPINDFVKFKEYETQHFELSGPMKQVLVHEVDKQRILRESSNRIGNMNDESSNQSPGVVTLSDHATNISMAQSVENGKYKSSCDSMQKVAANSASQGIKSLPSTRKVKEPGDVKMPSGRSQNFFDRFRKGKTAGNNNSSEAKAATSQRDSRPLLFKYNEGFTNAVKRPVRVRDLLL